MHLEWDSKRDASWVFTGLGVVALCWQVARAAWSRVGVPAPGQVPADPGPAPDRGGTS